MVYNVLLLISCVFYNTIMSDRHKLNACAEFSLVLLLHVLVIVERIKTE